MITLQSISKSFGQRQLFQKLNLTFEAGKVYALVGKSGSGKTTLLNMIGKLEKEDSGHIFYNDKSLQSISDLAFFRRHLGYLFQNFGLLDNQSIQDNLELGLIGKKMGKQEKTRALYQALEQVNLGYLELNRKIFELSGGEAQRVALAKIILKNPSLILADEPTAALDPKNSEAIMTLLLQLKSPERLIIIATHNPAIWEKADCVIRIEEIVTLESCKL